jgi:hypothetical protein
MHTDNVSKNPRNWSRAKRYFVTFEICFLTFSVYIGSAIYTPGLMGVMQEFGVAQVPAVLGLTLYVAGYGLGPIIWSPLSEIPQVGRLWVYIGTLRKLAPFSIYHSIWVNTFGSSCFCIVPAAHGVFGQLWYAAGLPVLDWIFWLASPCNRRGVDCRHVSTEEASLWPGSLGNRCSMRPRLGSPRRRVRCHVQRMDMDDMGDHVAIRVLLGCAVLFLSGD